MHNLQGCIGSRMASRRVLYCVIGMLLWKCTSFVGRVYLGRKLIGHDDVDVMVALPKEVYGIHSRLILHKNTDRRSRVPTEQD